MLIACEKPKDWECTCWYDGPPNGRGKQTKSIYNTKQRAAEKQCNDYGKELSGVNVYTCQIDVK